MERMFNMMLEKTKQSIWIISFPNVFSPTPFPAPLLILIPLTFPLIVPRLKLGIDLFHFFKNEK